MSNGRSRSRGGIGGGSRRFGRYDSDLCKLLQILVSTLRSERNAVISILLMNIIKSLYLEFDVSISTVDYSSVTLMELYCNTSCIQIT